MSGGGSSTDKNESVDRGTGESAEVIGSQQSILQALRAGDIFRSGSIDPRQRLQTMDADKQRLTEQLAQAQQRYAENLSAVGVNPAARGNVDNLFMQIQGIREQMDNLDASKKFVEEQAGLTQQGIDVGKQFVSKLQRGLETGDFVDPAERAAMTTAASSLSQDVATTRGLNRTDVPVMQAIAPTLASMWLGQQNANKAFYTGAQQFNQGLGLQQNQSAMQVSNPGLGLASVYTGVRGSNVTGTSNMQNRPGGLDYLNTAGQLAQGFGQAASGGKAAGLWGCWIAEALYGVDTLETHTIRWWLNIHFVQSPIGWLVMRFYRCFGEQIAGYVKRSTVLQSLLRPLFHTALENGKRALGVYSGLRTT